MIIRVATRDDVPEILDISNWAAAYTAANFAVEPETLDHWLASFDGTHRMHPWFVAEHEGAVIGFAKASPHRGRCAYAWTAEVSVYVRNDLRGKGIGKALYEALIPTLERQGYVTLIAGITVPNPASQRLHESFGFKRTATFHRVGWKFGQWHDVGYWELLLVEGAAAPPTVKPVRNVIQG